MQKEVVKLKCKNRVKQKIVWVLESVTCTLTRLGVNSLSCWVKASSTLSSERGSHAQANVPMYCCFWDSDPQRPMGLVEQNEKETCWGGVGLLRAVDYGSYKGPTDTFPVCWNQFPAQNPGWIPRQNRAEYAGGTPPQKESFSSEHTPFPGAAKGFVLEKRAGRKWARAGISNQGLFIRGHHELSTKTP